MTDKPLVEYVVVYERAEREYPFTDRFFVYTFLQLVNRSLYSKAEACVFCNGYHYLTSFFLRFFCFFFGYLSFKFFSERADLVKGYICYTQILTALIGVIIER